MGEIEMTWQVGDRVSWTRAVPGHGRVPRRKLTITGVVAGVDNGPIPGVTMRFDEPDPLTGLLDCYAAHHELSPLLGNEGP